MSDSGEAPYADQNFEDREAAWLAANDLATNDAVAGETVTKGVGNGNDGATGGSPREGSPIYDEHDSSFDVTQRDPADFDDAVDDVDNRDIDDSDVDNGADE
jgi:hypothetical protein